MCHNLKCETFRFLNLYRTYLWAYQISYLVLICWYKWSLHVNRYFLFFSQTLPPHICTHHAIVLLRYFFFCKWHVVTIYRECLLACILLYLFYLFVTSSTDHEGSLFSSGIFFFSWHFDSHLTWQTGTFTGRQWIWGFYCANRRKVI